jgi:hypothetical protein
MALQREEILKQGMENVLNYIKDLEARIVALEDIIEDITEDAPTYEKQKEVQTFPKPSFELKSWLSQAKKVF